MAKKYVKILFFKYFLATPS